MQASPQAVQGGVTLVGPQPANPASAQAAVDTAVTLGVVDEMPATNPGSGTVSAKLGALMMAAVETNEQLARIADSLDTLIEILGDRNG